MSDDVTRESESTVVETQILMPGQRLKQARELRGLSATQVAQELRLGLRFVEAIEADTYKELPEPAFVRGYMRRYAQLVKLSPDEIAASFDQYYSADTETPDLHERAQNPIQLLGSLVSPRLRLRKVLSMASIGLVLALLVGFLWHGFSTRETSTIVEPAVKAAVVKEKASTVVSVPVSTGNTVTVPVASTPSVPVEAATSVSTPAAASAPSVVNVVSPPAVMVPAATVPAIPTRSAQPNSAVSVGVGSDTLVIHLSAESWVSVQDSLQSLVSELKPAGQTLTLKGQAPFRINLGNAPAVSVTLNGKAIDLRPYTKGAVATLTARP